MTLSVFLTGQKWFGAEVFKALRQMHGIRIVGVSSPREAAGKPDRLFSQCEMTTTPWYKAGTINARTLPDGVDLIVAAHSHDFIGEKTRHRAKYGGIGYHPSLLPIHRGRDAIRWAIRDRDRVTGGTVYRLSNKIDGGPILFQDWCFIRPDDTPEELWKRDLAPMGVRLLIAAVGQHRDLGFIPGSEQDEELATFEPGMNPPPLTRPDLLMLEHKKAAHHGP